jgi:hypothetical protein
MQTYLFEELSGRSKDSAFYRYSPELLKIFPDYNTNRQKTELIFLNLSKWRFTEHGERVA